MRTDALSTGCKDLLDALVDEAKRVTITAPTLAEILRGDQFGPVPSVADFEVLAFDEPAAEILGRKLPFSFIRQVVAQTGLPQDYVKYDALIVATASRHKIDCVISLDEKRFKKYADQLGLRVAAPADFFEKQGNLPLQIVPKIPGT